MNNTVNSGTKNGYQVEEINGKKMLCIYAHGERIQAHDLADFSNSLRAELEVSADKQGNSPIHQAKAMGDFAYFLHNIDFSSFDSDRDAYKFGDPKIRETIDSMIEDRFLLIVKPRGIFMSTLLDTYALWSAAFHGKEVIILCSNNDACKRHITRINRISHLQGASEMLGQAQATNGNMKSLDFKNNGRIQAKNGKHSFRGENADVIIWDEAAFLKDSEELYTSISMKQESQFIMASTPNQKEDIFYEMYRRRKMKEVNQFDFKHVNDTVAKAYKFNKEHLILRFRVPAYMGIDDYEVVCEDDIYTGDQKVFNKFEVLPIHERYRGTMTADSQEIDLLVSVKIPTVISSLNVGYDFDFKKFGIKFSLWTAVGGSSSMWKVIEIPFGAVKNNSEMPILPKAKATGNKAIDAADMIHDIMSSGNYGEMGYERLRNGKLNFDKNRLHPAFTEQQIHQEYDCKFALPKLESESGKIVNIRMSGDMMGKIGERLDELQILTKKDHTLSDYIRGLIAKDLD